MDLVKSDAIVRELVAAAMEVKYKSQRLKDALDAIQNVPKRASFRVKKKTNFRRSLNTAKARFVLLRYLMHRNNDTPVLVKGYAFETPGWPEWHACVRWGNRWGDDLFHNWIVDHYETGLAISPCGTLARKEDAPEAMRKVLESKGKELIAAKLKSLGLQA